MLENLITGEMEKKKKKKWKGDYILTGQSGKLMLACSPLRMYFELGE